MPNGRACRQGEPPILNPNISGICGRSHVSWRRSHGYNCVRNPVPLAVASAVAYRLVLARVARAASGSFRFTNKISFRFFFAAVSRAKFQIKGPQTPNNNQKLEGSNSKSTQRTQSVSINGRGVEIESADTAAHARREPTRYEKVHEHG